MKLYLLQHGDALPEEVNPNRSLSERGREDVKRLAEFVGTHGIRVKSVYHSGKTRARETAEIVTARMATSVKIETITGLN
ncbi:MAG: histidine phosphatase family protein, partial [Burkholderiales bacterium]